MSLNLVANLIKSLEQEGVRYCHWKSNTAMSKTLSGENDLDLLVSGDDMERFLSLLRGMGFVQCLSPHEKWFPGITNYYGYDPQDDNAVHVHLHEKLIVGYDLIKNYHLPVEETFLKSVKHESGLRIPPCELEFIMLVIRLVLKRRLLAKSIDLMFLLERPADLLKGIFGTGACDLSSSAQEELDDLGARVDLDKLEKLRETVFPFISRDQLHDCLNSLSRDAGRFAWLKAGWKLAVVLKPCRRHGAAASLGLTVWRGFIMRLRGVVCRFGRMRRPRKRLFPLGKIIAVVGGDGAGKSTNLKAVESWFGAFLNVTTIHMGKPPKGVAWYLVGGLLKVRKLLLRTAGDQFHQSAIHLMVARYRFKAFRRAVKLRGRGELVCLDRFPIAGMKHMDVPRIQMLTGGRGRIFSRMARQEEKYFSKIRGADELIVLLLDPAIAALRRPEDDQQLLSDRSGEIWKREWPEGFAHLVDASSSLEQVKREIRCIIWKSFQWQSKVIELVGPAGSGKSTTADLLLEKTSNVATSITWRENKLLFLKIMARRLPNLIEIKRASLGDFMAMVKVEAELSLLQKHKRSPVMPCRNYVLEIGPLFHLSKMNFDKEPAELKWFHELEVMAQKTIDLVVWLDAPNDVLCSRIKARQKPHRIKDAEAESMNQFFEKYRSCFARVIGGEDVRVPLKRINTEKMTANDVFEDVVGSLQ